MKSSLKITIFSSGFNIVWVVYTLHYILLFSLISSRYFDTVAPIFTSVGVVELNIVMNTISLVLATIGLVITYYASRHDSHYWNILNRSVYALMILWVFGGSAWALFMMF